MRRRVIDNPSINNEIDDFPGTINRRSYNPFILSHIYVGRHLPYLSSYTIEISARDNIRQMS